MEVHTMNATMTMNNAKQGIEIRFNGKPDSSIIGSLKDNGFRWSPKQKMWYAKQSEDRLAFATTLDGIEIEEIPNQPKASAEPEIFDLWAMTRTENIGDNMTTTKYQPLKEVAAIIRQHLRGRFPFCKWSVRSDRSSIDIELKSSPFDKDSEENNAIVDYAEKYKESFNWNHSDYYSDYFDVRFYGHAIVDWQFVQTEYPPSETISENFKTAKAAYEAEEEERIRREYEERKRQREAEAKAYEERRKLEEAQIAQIEANAEITDLPEDRQYFVENLLTARLNKLNTVEEIKEHITKESYRQDCKISREVRLPAEDYANFSRLLLDDFSFLDGMGGSQTDDLRIGSMIDYDYMTEEEKATVKWYNHNCVAIYCEEKLMLVIDPQGYGYARYTFIYDEYAIVEKDHIEALGITQEEYADNLTAAEIITDVSAEIITGNHLLGKWYGDDFKKYRQLMTKEILSRHLRFDVGVIRAVLEENLKAALYRIFTQPLEIAEQFINAGLTKGQKITLITNSSGFVTATKVTFDSFEIGKYAQYDNAVKLMCIPEGKRNVYHTWFYGKIVILDGWHDIPRSLLWEELPSSTGVTRVERTICLSFDPKQYDIVLEYFKSQGIRPIINTAKPIF